MPFASLDTAAVARALAQVADRPDDLADAYFERLEEIELPPEGEPPGVRVRREEGLALRLVRERTSWLAARDAIGAEAFADALRQVARALPPTPYPEPHLDPGPWPDTEEAAAAEELAELPLAVARSIRARHAAFPLRLAVRRHRREVQVVGPQVVAPAEREIFYSLEAHTAQGAWGTLLPTLEGAAELAAESLVERFRARHAPSPDAVRGDVVLGPAAAAVFLHEAVAHALEADILALSARPEAAIGLAMAPAGVHVLDDPAAAPAPVARGSDDEGVTVDRRWLLRDGRVAQPLADRSWARVSEALTPGSARRGSRHEPPGPRSSHLELLADGDGGDLLADAEGGIYFAEADRGALDPLSGRFTLRFPCGRRLRGGAPAEPVGPCRLRGTVADLLGRIAGVGAEARVAGAGWCAKGGRKLPVWATSPPLRLADVEVTR